MSTRCVTHGGMDEVGKVPNLERRKAVYRCRMRCPQHLLREGIRKESSISLRTKERAVALERLPAARVQLMEYFQGKQAAPARSGIVPTHRRHVRPSHPDLPMLRKDEVAAAARDYFAAGWEQLELDTAELMEMSVEAKHDWRIELEDRFAAIDCPDPDDEDPALSTEIATLQTMGRRSPYASDESRLLRTYLRRAMRQLIQIEIARADGDFASGITDSFFVVPPAPLVHTSERRRADGISLADCIERYSSEVLLRRPVTSKTKDKYTATLSVVAQFFGNSTLVVDIERSRCNEFRDLLAALPPNFGKIAAGRTLEQVADDNVGKTLAWETQTYYLKAVSDLLGWAVKERLLADNVAEKIEPLSRRQAADEQRLPFRMDELAKMFEAPIYTGCKNDERGFAKPGPNIIKRSRYWLPLLALFTGMRMGEILQLTPGHIRRSPNGNPFIVLTRDMDLKTPNAEEICGWSRGKRTSRRYGTGIRADRLKPFVDRVSYELDLSHLT